MKKQPVLNVFISIAGCLLLFSCGNNKDVKAETDKAHITDTSKLKANTAADTTTLSRSAVAKDKAGEKENEESEENEKKEQD